MSEEKIATEDRCPYCESRDVTVNKEVGISNIVVGRNDIKRPKNMLFSAKCNNKSCGREFTKVVVR